MREVAQANPFCTTQAQALLTAIILTWFRIVYPMRCPTSIAVCIKVLFKMCLPFGKSTRMAHFAELSTRPIVQNARQLQALDSCHQTSVSRLTPDSPGDGCRCTISCCLNYPIPQSLSFFSDCQAWPITKHIFLRSSKGMQRVYTMSGN